MLRLTLLAAVSMVMGCTSVTEVSAGYARTLQTGRNQVTVNARRAWGGEHLLLDYAVRARFGEHTQQGALSVGASAVSPLGDHVIPHLAFGLHLLEAGRVDGDFALGAGSPWAGVGVTFLPSPNSRTYREGGPFAVEGCATADCQPRLLSEVSGWGITIGSSIEYDIRLTDQANEWIWSLTIGASLVERTTRVDAVGIYPGDAI